MALCPQCGPGSEPDELTRFVMRGGMRGLMYSAGAV